MLTNQQRDNLIEDALRGARPAMKRTLGESPAAYDKADVIAEGIAHGVRMGLYNLGLITTEQRG